MNEEPQGVAPEIAPGHNPDSLTVAQVGEGWRLLDEDELISKYPNNTYLGVERWSERRWDDNQGLGYGGCMDDTAYRTRLSREDLRAARGLTPSAQGPLTHDEVMEIFGDTMPIEAANLLANPPDGLTCKEAREMLTAIARKVQAPEPLCVCGHEKWHHHNEQAFCFADGHCCCLTFRPARPAQGEARCPKCGHAVHLTGRCLNMASDSDCDCDHGTEGEVLFSAPAQAISAEDRAKKLARRLIGYIAAGERFSPEEREAVENDITQEMDHHAAQEVSRVEGNFNRMREIANQRMDELAQLRESLARVEGERDDMQRARDLEQQSVGNLITQVSALTAERDAMKLERDELRNRIQTDFMSGVAMELERERDALKAQVEEADPVRWVVTHDAFAAEQWELRRVSLATIQPKGQE